MTTMTETPLAYLITFTCYGTWLHGDTRGSVDHSHNKFGMPFVETDMNRINSMRAKMKYPPLFLSDDQRTLVSAVITEVCTYRQWTLYECNVRTNHLHVVVGGNAEPDKMMKDFKAYSTRRLRESKELDAERSVWTEGASMRYLWTEDSLAAAIEYVRNQ
jgi:REP element-mobilizing transposase RayT